MREIPERRRLPRYPVYLDCEYRLAGETDWRPARLLSAGEQGGFVGLNESELAPVGTEAVLRVPVGAETWELAVRVCWRSLREPRGLGLEFAELPAEKGEELILEILAGNWFRPPEPPVKIEPPEILELDLPEPL